MPQRARSMDLDTIVSRLGAYTNDAIVITAAEPVGQPGPVIVWANPAFTRMTGYSLEEVLGKTPRILQGPGTDPAERARIHKALTRWKPVQAEMLNYRKDGTPFWVEINIVPVADSKGWYHYWVSVQRETTERREREQQLEATRLMAETASQAKSRFVANMSHELRTPLNAILGFAELLEASSLTAEQQRHVGIILETGRQLQGLLADVLDISRLDAGRIAIRQSVFDLGQLMHGLVPLVELQLGEKPVSFALDLDPTLPAAVAGDALRLKQILTNLLSNAAKFTKSGSITLSVHPAADEPGRIRFAVADTGSGIPAEAQERLFQPFSRIAETAGLTRGTGLGLAISQRLAELMGGRIEVDSEAGRGSTFTLDLPLPAEDESRLPRISPAVPALLEPLQVLAVDDTATNRELIGALLRHAGHQVTTAKDGAEAVAAVGRKVPDLILMDVSMPILDGIEATRRIRAMGGAAAEVPIIALSAHAFASDVEACQAAGMNDHLSKPIETRALFAALARHAPPHRRIDAGYQAL
ncbi:MAG: ATP-binding protein [Geminicoccaceae bacterium]